MPVEEEVRPLFSQMRGYRYRGGGPFSALLRFHPWRLLAFPLLILASWAYWEIPEESAASVGSGVLLIPILIGAGFVYSPSTFPAWLLNTARRGFLRDLAMAGLRGDQIVRCHYAASAPIRMLRLATVSFCILCLAATAEIFHNTGLRLHIQAYLAVLTIATWYHLATCQQYRSAIRGESVLRRFLGALFVALPCAVLLSAGAVVISVFIFEFGLRYLPLLGHDQKMALRQQGLSVWKLIPSWFVALAMTYQLGQNWVASCLDHAQIHWEDVVARALRHELNTSATDAAT